MPRLSGQRRARKAVKSEAALGRARVRATLDAEHAVLFLAANGNHVFGLRSAGRGNAHPNGQLKEADPRLAARIGRE